MPLSYPRGCAWLVGLGLCLVAGSRPPMALSAPAESTGAPRPLIEIVEAEKDGGVVEQGTVVQYRFTLHNRGQADLVIRQVKPSCGCSVAKWERLVKPGAASVIEAEMHTEHFRGAISKHLTVISNDLDHPQVDLIISARVEPVVWIKPGPAAEISVADRPVTEKFVLERNGGRPMKVLQVSPAMPFVTAEATPLPGDGRFQVKVTVSPDAPLGRSVVAVAVRTDLEKGGSLSLQVIVNKGIVTEPPVVFYGLVPLEIKSPIQAAVTLTRHSSPFHVKTVSVEDSQLAARLETVHEGTEYRVTVTYAGGWITGLKQTLMTVTTDDPVQPTLKIPVQAVIQTKVTQLPTATVH
jgi:hypothetical protein